MKQLPLALLVLAAGLTGCQRASSPAPAPAPASSDAASGSADTVATLGGRAVTLADVDKAWMEKDAPSRNRFLQEQFESRSRVLDELVADYLIGEAAAAAHLTSEKYLQQELAKRTKPITNEQIAAFYQSLGNQNNGMSLAQLTGPIRDHLDMQQRAEAKDALVNELRSRSKSVALSLPQPRIAVKIDADDPSLGPETAPVQIVEFADFQCPFCQRAAPTIKQLRTEFGDKIRLVYKHFPLPNHPDAVPAALASECVKKQGKFWPYHDRLFSSQQALDMGHLKQYASEVGADTSQFDQCVSSEETRAAVQADAQQGQAYGITATPAFFVNGRQVTGAQPYDVFAQIVREELNARPR